MSDALQVQVNWVNAMCDNVKKELVKCYGFSAHASKRFVTSLSNSNKSFLGRVSQLIGFSALDMVQTAIFIGNRGLLERIHRRIYKPRHKLTRTIFYADINKKLTVNAPTLVAPLFDGLMWRARLNHDGLRRFCSSNQEPWCFR